MFRKTIAFCIAGIPLFAGWSTPELIDASFDSPASEDVFVSYNPTAGQYFATWGDSHNEDAPTYSLYTPGSGWSAPELISADNPVANDVFSAYDSLNGKTLAVWGDEHFHASGTGPFPIYSFYTPHVGWSSPELIDETRTSLATYDVFVSAGADGEFLATWADMTNGNRPTFAFYESSGTTLWSAYEAIDSTSYSSSDFDVFSAFDSTTGKYLAMWVDADTGYVTYSLYTHGTGWSHASVIGSAALGNFDAYCSFDAMAGQFVATWADKNTGVPTYAFYTEGSGWSSVETISDAAVDSDVVTAYDSTTGSLLATWLDEASRNPFYSFYLNGRWSAPAAIGTNLKPGFDVFSAYDSAMGEFVAVWGATNSSPVEDLPAYSVFTPIESPLGFSGRQRRNNFAVASERYNALVWKTNLEAASYNLYRNGVLIATLGGNASSYNDHNQPPGAVQNYQLTVISPEGYEASASITVEP